MAAPQTHFVITFGFRAIFAFVIGITFSFWQLILLYFWGTLDIDHFLSPKFVKDIFRRIRRFFKGGDVGSPSVESPPPWLHLWPGVILSIVCGKIFFPPRLCWIPFVLWLSHRIIDGWQKNDGSYPHYPLFYPLMAKEWIRKSGYPIKPRIEILISTALAALIIIFEAICYFK